MKKVLGLCVALAVSVNAEALGQVEAGADELVSAVKPDLLIAQVIPGAVPIGDSRLSHGFFLDRSYSAPSPLPDVELLFGVFESRELAAQRLIRTTPQVPWDHFLGEETEGFLSASGVHFRFRNLVVVLLAQGRDTPVDLLREWMKDLQAAMGDGEVVVLGGNADFPVVEVLQLYKAETVPVEKGVGFLVHVPPGEVELLTNGWVRDGRQDRHVLGPGRSVVRVSKASLSREPVLRVARATGEIVEVPLSEARERGVPVVPAPVAEPTRSMTEASKRFMVRVVMDPESDLGRRGELLYQLVELEDPDLVPVFEEILAFDQDSVLKQYAFRGICQALEEGGLESYRKYAADPEQPEIVRRDAILRLSAYGQPKDLALLRELVDSGMSSLQEAAARAIRNIEAREQAALR